MAFCCSFEQFFLSHTKPSSLSFHDVSFLKHHTFNSLHKHSMKSLKMMDESEGLIANMMKQVEHMVVDSLVSVMVDVPHSQPE